MNTEHPAYEVGQFQWRRRVVVGLMAAVAIAIVIRLFDIQVLHRSYWRDIGEQQYRARIRLEGERGAMTDRNGTVLATNMPTTSFALDPQMVRSVEPLVQAFEQAGLATAAQLRARIEGARDRNFVWLVRGVPWERASVLDTLKDPGLIRIRELRRTYVFDSLARQVLGTTDVDGRGIAGLELAYDSLLQGATTERVMERIGRGRLRPTLSSLTAVARPGASLELTLDADVQHLAERELAQSVATTGAAAGTVLILRPQTGELIACAQQPSFSHFRRNDIDALRLRAITDMYEPGSTFKAIVAAAALAEHRFSPEQLFDGHGGRLVLPDGRAITDHEPLGWCTLTDALVHSSNVVFAQIAAHLGQRTLYRYSRDFGFGVRTDIELPGEARGMLKLPRQLDRSDIMFMGFGYGIACTPLQLACAYAAIANDGVLMQPYLTRRITAPDGQIIVERKPQRIRRVVPADVARLLRRMLQQVVERGTGMQARIEGIPVAGKTGTAQQWTDGSYSKRDYTASFVGMVPADTPALVILVMLDRPRTDIYGGSTAAPLFRRIVEALVAHPTIAMRYTIGRQIQPTPTWTDSVMTPDVRGLPVATARQILDAFELRATGTVGIPDQFVVVSQDPPPATLTPRYRGILLHTAPAGTLRRLPLTGLPVRNVVALAHALGLSVEFHGTGRIQSYHWRQRGKQELLLLVGEPN